MRSLPRPALSLALAAIWLLGAAAWAQEETIVRYGQDFFAARTPKTALDMLAMLPGFVLSLGEPTARGYSASTGNVLVDGKRSSDKQFALDTLLNRIPADQVDHIELIRGGHPGIDMLGQTIVANVVRKAGAADSTVLSLSDAVYSDGRMVPGTTLEATRPFEGGRQLSGAVSIQRYVELAEGNGTETIGSDRLAVRSRAGGITGYAYGRWEMPAWDGTLAVNGSLARTDYAIHETDQPQGAGEARQARDYMGGPLGGQLKGELGANYQRSLGEDLTTDSLVLLDLQNQTYASQTDQGGGNQLFTEHDHRGEALARSSWHYQALSDLAAEATLEGAYNWLGTDTSLLAAGIPIALPNARAGIDEWRAQAGIHLIWSASSAVQLELSEQVERSVISARADRNSSRALFHAKPRFAATYTPGPDDQVRLRVEREVGQLDFSNFVAASSLATGAIRSGNTDIVPQRDWVFEIAYDRHFWTDSDVQLTLRHLVVGDVADRVPVHAPGGAIYDAPGNIGAGSENAAIASVTLGLDRFGMEHGQLKLGATRQLSRVTDPTTGTRRAITDLDPLEYSVSLRQELPDWRSAWGASLATPCFTSTTVKGCGKSEFRFDETDVYRAEPAFNLYAEHQLTAGTALRLEIDNIFEQRYRLDTDLYDGPRGPAPPAVRQRRDLASARSVLFSLRLGL